MTPFSKRKKGQRGVVLVMTAVLTIVLFALLGMAVDLGRMFIIKHEAQVFTDAAALAAALKLDGTQAGIIAANNAVDPGTNKWNMGTQGFSVVGAASYTTKFSNSANGPWVAAGSVPVNATGYVYVKVTAALTVPVYFIGVVVPINNTPVNAMSVAAQAPDTTLYAGGFPFTPKAFPGASTANATLGFTVGQQYTIRYPANPSKDPCAGDIGIHTRDSLDRGYWGDNSASTIRRRIVDDYQSGATVTIGQPLDLTGGARSGEASDVNDRAAQDGDQTSMTPAAYQASLTHNGRRMVTMPITDYGSGVALGFGAFLLLPSGNYQPAANTPWCVIYVGPAVEGASHGGGASSPGTGAAHVRLVQ